MAPRPKDLATAKPARQIRPDFELPSDDDQPDGWQDRADPLWSRWKGMLQEVAPDYLEAFNDWVTRAQEHEELDPKVREFIVCALDAVIYWRSPFFDNHMHRAFNEGATIREFVEVGITVSYSSGPHPASHFLSTLYKVIKDRQARGLPTPLTRSTTNSERTATQPRGGRRPRGSGRTPASVAGGRRSG